MFSDVDDFVRQVDCKYKGEHYSVRDNGAICRYGRKNQRKRKLDNRWTFGRPNAKGYLFLSSEVVHRIVAYAFLGEPPTSQHVVDHIDTNRQNNRPENLRWLTKLENILNNPITVKRIEFHCGSIEAFLRDPSVLRNHENKDRNFGWMRSVTPAEAQASWNRLSNWAASKSGSSLYRGNSLGEWIYKPIERTEKERILEEQSNNGRIDEMIEVVLKEVEKHTGINREQFSSKSKKREYLYARVYAAKQLRSKIDLSEERISKLVGRSKSMVNTYLNHTNSFIRNADFDRG